MSTVRDSLFISHANPEDNEFALWLGAKLAALGYEVWADVLRLRGGDDWQRKLEEALRNRAFKVILVGTSVAVDKQGVRNEIQIAHDIGKKTGDAEFIIPLRLEAFDAPFLIAHAQYIDFADGWAAGFGELVETLESTYQAPKVEPSVSTTREYWREIHTREGQTLSAADEQHVSNWLGIRSLPERVRYYDFKAGIEIGPAEAAKKSATLPLVPFKRGFLSFAAYPELQDYFGPDLPIELEGECPTEEFLDNGWAKREITSSDAERHVVRMLRAGIQRYLADRELRSFQMSRESLAWWAPVSLVPTEQIPFAWSEDLRGRRQINGKSEKRGVYWHYGVTVIPRFFPIGHVKIISRMIFSTDGETPLDNPGRMHRTRRSIAKGWYNPKWRDMMLAFLHWLSNGERHLLIPLGSDQSLTLTLPPIVAVAPVSIVAGFDDAGPDEEPDDTLDDSDLYDGNGSEFDEDQGEDDDHD